MTQENTQQISLSNDFSLATTPDNTRVNIQIGGVTITVASDIRVHISITANDGAPQLKAIPSAASAPAALEEKEFIEVGDLHPVDGTICINVDDRRNEAHFVPKSIFVGKTIFDLNEQDALLALVNEEPESVPEVDKVGHGRRDWARIINSQATILANVMDKVVPHVPAGLRSRANQDFWMASTFGASGQDFGQVLRAGEPMTIMDKKKMLWMPVIRKDKARMSELTL